MLSLSLPDPCTLPVEEGDCDGFIPVWYYKIQSGTCEQFMYSGCGGNKNRYTSHNQCAQQCGADVGPQPEPEQPDEYALEIPVYGELFKRRSGGEWRC